MKQLFLNMIKGWLIQKAQEKLFPVLRKKAKDLRFSFDDEAVDELEAEFLNWLNRKL